MLYAIAFVYSVHSGWVFGVLMLGHNIAPADFQLPGRTTLALLRANFHLRAGTRAIFGNLCRLRTSAAQSGPATCMTKPGQRPHFLLSFVGMNLGVFSPCTFWAAGMPRRNPGLRPTICHDFQHGIGQL